MMRLGPLFHALQRPPEPPSPAVVAQDKGPTRLRKWPRAWKCPHPDESGQGRMALRRSGGGTRRLAEDRHEDRLELYFVGWRIRGAALRLRRAAELPVTCPRGAVLGKGLQDGLRGKARRVGDVVSVAESQRGDVHCGRHECGEDPGESPRVCSRLASAAPAGARSPRSSATPVRWRLSPRYRRWIPGARPAQRPPRRRRGPAACPPRGAPRNGDGRRGWCTDRCHTICGAPTPQGRMCAMPFSTRCALTLRRHPGHLG